MQVIIPKKYILPFLGFLVPVLFLTCIKDPRLNNESMITLNRWTFTMGEYRKEVRSVPWQWPEEAGGAGVNKNGVGTYRIEVVIPERYRGTTLAFYCDSIDDADITRFNGIRIGSRGKGLEGDSPQSAVHETRMYIIPESIIRFGQKNSIEIRVLDIAGDGGFVLDNNPVIGTYSTLSRRSAALDILVNVPGTLFVGVLILLLALYMYRLGLFMTEGSWRVIFSLLLSSFNIGFFFRGEKRKTFPVIHELAFWYTLNIGIAFLSLILILSRLTWKYVLIPWEPFWFWGPSIGIYIVFLFINILYHREIFDDFSLSKQKGAGGHLWTVLAILTHPLVNSIIILLMLVRPMESSWKIFYELGTLYIALICIIFFTVAMVRFFRAGSREKPGTFRTVIRRQAWLRVLFILMFVTGIVFLQIQTILFSTMATLFIISSLVLYLFASITWYSNYHQALPELQVKEGLDSLLHEKYRLTRTEVSLCRDIVRGFARQDICYRHSISENTFKNHMKSIYSKTIDLGQEESAFSSGKMQRLTVFLNNLAEKQTTTE